MTEVIGFIGLGNMGTPMVGQLLNAGYTVQVFDMSENALKQARELGASVAASIADTARGATIVLTMLPAGEHVRAVYLAEDGLIASAAPGTLLIDSSTIDVETSRAVGAAAVKAELEMIDAPVTGGVMAARVGKLNFMVGGTQESFDRAKPVLETMGRKIVFAGPQGSGIGVKICNNMSLGISMIAAAETLMLASARPSLVPRLPIGCRYFLPGSNG